MSDLAPRPGDGLPDSAIQAAAEVRFRQYESEYSAGHLTWRDFADEVREVLAAAAPAIRAAERERLALKHSGDLSTAAHLGYENGLLDGAKAENARILAIAAREHAVVPCHDPATGAHVAYAPFGMILAEHDATRAESDGGES